eukprot:TRINITY_DN6214_c0_g1_i3.p1 TRINITY_DN6214_c0_g1~~TRINITY_DN6214_c0_g1_i3.p1  ORF type:complete len:1936 (+),score=450.62 TRINITY_DN6214_c0_g1_i3:95-5902(+)
MRRQRCATVALWAALPAVCQGGKAPGEGSCIDRLSVANGSFPGPGGDDSSCVSLPYNLIHSSFDVQRAGDELQLRRGALAAIQIVPSDECNAALTNALCSVSVPGCSSLSNAVLPCTSICQRYMLDCADELRVIASQPTQTQELFNCSMWRSLYDNASAPYSACPAWEPSDPGPCLKEEQVFAAVSVPSFAVQGPGSPCPLNGPPESIEPDSTQLDLLAQIAGWEPGVSKVLVLVMWPASVFLSIGLGAVANMMQYQSSAAKDAASNAKDAKSSIRFCIQVTLIVLVWLASAMMFFLAQWVADTNITSSFDNANQAQRQTFDSSNFNTELLRDQIFSAVGESFTRQVEGYFEAFAISHNSTIRFMQVNRLDPVNDSAVILSHMLLAAEISPLMESMTINVGITSVMRPQSVLDALSDRSGTGGTVALPCGSAVDLEGERRCSMVCTGANTSTCLHGSRAATNATVLVPYRVTANSLGPLVSAGLMIAGLSTRYRAWGFTMAWDENYTRAAQPIRRDPYVMADDGALIPETRCLSTLAQVVGCHNGTSSVYSTGPPGQLYWTGLWVYFGQLMIDLHMNWYVAASEHNRWQPDTRYGAIFPIAVISRGLKLKDVSDILQRLLQFEGQRLVLIENTTAGLVVALTHGDTSKEEAAGYRTPVPAAAINDMNTSSLLQNLVRNYSMPSCNEEGPAGGELCIGAKEYERPWPAIPPNKVEQRETHRLTPYYMVAQSLDYLNFRGIAFNMIPVFEIEGKVINTTKDLHEVLNKNFTTVNNNYKQGNRFMIIVSIGIIFGAALVSYLIAITIAKPLSDMLKDMRDVAHFRVEAVVKRYTTGEKREGRRSAFQEINAMQAYFVIMVKQLAELKKFMPDTAIDDDDSKSSVSGRSGSSMHSRNSDNSESSEDEGARAERVVTVTVNYVDKKRAGPSSPASPAVRAPSGLGDRKQSRAAIARIASVTLGPKEHIKRTGLFQYHYTDAKVSNHEMLKQLRESVDLPVAEPVEVKAIVVNQGMAHAEDDDDGSSGAVAHGDAGGVEEVPITDSRALQHALELCGDRLELFARKTRKFNPVPVAASIWSMVAKSTKVLFLIHMFTGEYYNGEVDKSPTIRRIAIIFGLVITGGMVLNLVLAFRFTRQAMLQYKPMEEWLSHYHKEVTVGLVVSSFDVQNAEILYCGLRVQRLLRFFAPMPTALKNQIVRLSMVSLITGQLVPLLMHFWFMEEANQWDDTFALISLGFTVVAIFISGVKKCVAFCLVDESGVSTKNEFKVKEKKQTLKRKNVTVLRAGIANFSQLLGLPNSELAEICNAFYDQALMIVKTNKGNVTVIESGRMEAVFNAPSQLPMHEVFACRSAGALCSMRLPSGIMFNEAAYGPFRVVAGVVYGNMVSGNLGSAKRKAFHYMSPDIELLPALLRIADQIGARALLSSACADKIKERELESGMDWGIIRPAEVLVGPSDSGMGVTTVHELVATHQMDDQARSALQGQYTQYSSAFDFLEQDSFALAREELDEYLAAVRSAGREDPVAQHLHQRIQTAIAGGCTTIECFARGVGVTAGGNPGASMSMDTRSPRTQGLSGRSVSFAIGPGGSRLQSAGSASALRRRESNPIGEDMWALPDELHGLEMRPEIAAMIEAKQSEAARRGDSRPPIGRPDPLGKDRFSPEAALSASGASPAVSALSAVQAAEGLLSWSFTGPTIAHRTASGAPGGPSPGVSPRGATYRRISRQPTTGVLSPAVSLAESRRQSRANFSRWNTDVSGITADGGGLNTAQQRRSSQVVRSPSGLSRIRLQSSAGLSAVPSSPPAQAVNPGGSSPRTSASLHYNPLHSTGSGRDLRRRTPSRQHGGAEPRPASPERKPSAAGRGNNSLGRSPSVQSPSMSYSGRVGVSSSFSGPEQVLSNTTSGIVPTAPPRRRGRQRQLHPEGVPRTHSAGKETDEGSL